MPEPTYEGSCGSTDRSLAVLLQAAGPEENQDNQNDQAYAADGIKTPLLAMRPNRKTSHKRDKDKYRKNERQHVLASPFWPTASGLNLFRFARGVVRKTGQTVCPERP
jgi:hypothetical protein